MQEIDFANTIPKSKEVALMLIRKPFFSFNSLLLFQFHTFLIDF